jgi:hypothetical protein
MTLHRSLHVITDGAGSYLAGVEHGQPVFTPMPTAAIHAGLSWINSSVAAKRCQNLRELLPDSPWGIALVELELKTGSHEWVATRVCSWVSDDRPVSSAVMESVE